METVVHNICELDGSQRTAAEQLVGHPLNNDQKLVIQVVAADTRTSEPPSDELGLDEDQLPGWCNVYEGLTDQEIDALEKAILTRFDLTSPHP